MGRELGSLGESVYLDRLIDTSVINGKAMSTSGHK